MTPLFWQHGQIDDEGRHQDGPLQHVDEVHGDMVGIISEWIAYRPVQTSIRTGQRQTTDLPDSTSLRGGFRYFKSVQDHVKGRGPQRSNVGRILPSLRYYPRYHLLFYHGVFVD
ncbi:hypothetical protein DL546_003541 [Coniochaeta pulveracea]|uniref:Uncharacterized protein n=1 Tax=Coniochaeta pulveracea TaxID=177199 RepID=A0A420Y688_9PEZI|nr:hypothetical protein DL546_003541 [Coniochaeta pulveracea]